jgi:predicted HTH domain antitoxin
VTKQQLSFYNDKAVLEEGDFFVSKIKPYYKNKSFLIKLLIPFLAILFGFIIGFASHDGINNFFSKTKHTPVTPVPDYDEEGTSMTKDLAIKFLKDADDVLRSNNLEFSKIDELYKQYLEFKNVIDDVDEELFSNKVCDRIEDYNKVMTFVMTGDVDQLRKALSDYDYNSFHIWQQHADLLKEIFKDEIGEKEQSARTEGKIQAYAEMVDDGDLTVERAAEKLGMTIQEFQRAVEKIKHNFRVF